MTRDALAARLQDVVRLTNDGDLAALALDFATRSTTDGYAEWSTSRASSVPNCASDGVSNRFTRDTAWSTSRRFASFPTRPAKHLSAFPPQSCGSSSTRDDDSSMPTPENQVIDPLRTTLDSYEARDTREVDDLRRVRALLERPDPWSRMEPLHITASALVLHPTSGRVLLRWHERMQRWMQVGGHGEPGERDPWEVAQREACEETGLRDLRALSPGHERIPAQVVIVPVGAHGDEPAHEHADVRYLLSTAAPDAVRSETDAARLRWLPVTDAIEEVEEDNLRTFLVRALASLHATARRSE